MCLFLSKGDTSVHVPIDDDDGVAIVGGVDLQ